MARPSLIALFRGPVLHTPQGQVFLVTSAAYVLLGMVLLRGDTGILPSSRNTAIGCFFMPLVLFLIFLRLNGPKFLPSGRRAIWGLLLAAAPLYFAWPRR